MKSDMNILELIKNQRYDEAENTISGLYFHNDPKLYYYYIALCRCAQGNFQRAVKYFEKAEGQGLCTCTLYYNMGVAFLELKDFIMSEKHFKTAININNKFNDAYQNLAHIYLLKGDISGAYRIIKTCTSINPTFELKSLQNNLLTKLLKTS